jgi:hypothetical protein
VAEAKSSTSVKIPGLDRIPYVVVELPGNKLVLRHPDEVTPTPGGVAHPHAPGYLEPK